MGLPSCEPRPGGEHALCLLPARRRLALASSARRRSSTDDRDCPFVIGLGTSGFSAPAAARGGGRPDVEGSQGGHVYRRFGLGWCVSSVNRECAAVRGGGLFGRGGSICELTNWKLMGAAFEVTTPGSGANKGISLGTKPLGYFPGK